MIILRVIEIILVIVTGIVILGSTSSRLGPKLSELHKQQKMQTHLKQRYATATRPASPDGPSTILGGSRSPTPPNFKLQTVFPSLCGEYHKIRKFLERTSECQSGPTTGVS